MPVIINEFEVLAEEPEEPGTVEKEKEEEQTARKIPTPHDIVLVIQHWQARQARVRVY